VSSPAITLFEIEKSYNPTVAFTPHLQEENVGEDNKEVSICAVKVKQELEA
jgi:hypothetical protein